MLEKFDSQAESSEGLPIYLHTEFQKDNIKKPLVVMMHGFKAFKEWGFFPYLQERLANAGAITINMDFSLNGISDRENMIYDPDKFARNTFTRELSDLQQVLNDFDSFKIIDEETVEKNFNGEIYLLGHSLGGAVSIVTAKKDKRINRIALWASIAEMDRYTERQKEHWRKTGFIEFTIAHTKQVLRLNVSYMEDKLQNQDDYGLTQSISTLNIPILIIHGSEDLTVKKNEGIKLAEHAPDGLSKLVIIEKTGHGFGTKHPFTESNPQLEQAIEETINFFDLK